VSPLNPTGFPIAKIVWNSLVAVATMGGVGCLVVIAVAFSAREKGDIVSINKVNAGLVLLSSYIVVAINWGLLTSTLYDRITIWKRLLIVALSVTPFLMYEWHCNWYVRHYLSLPSMFRSDYGLVDASKGIMSGAEYFLAYCPPAAVAAVVMIARRSVPTMTVAVTRRTIRLACGRRSAIVGSTCAKCGMVFHFEVKTCPKCSTLNNPA